MGLLSDVELAIIISGDLNLWIYYFISCDCISSLCMHASTTRGVKFLLNTMDRYNEYYLSSGSEFWSFIWCWISHHHICWWSDIRNIFLYILWLYLIPMHASTTRRVKIVLNPLNNIISYLFKEMLGWTANWESW